MRLFKRKKTKRDENKTFFNFFSQKTSKMGDKLDEQGEKFKEFWKKFQKEQLPELLKQEQFKEQSEKFKQSWRKFQSEHLPKITYLAFKHSPTIFADLLAKKYLLLPVYLYQLLQDIGKQYNISFPFIDEKQFYESEDYKQLEIIIKMAKALLKAKELKKDLK